MHDRLPPKGVCPGSCDLFKFWEISDNNSETVQDRYIVATKHYQSINQSIKQTNKQHF